MKYFIVSDIHSFYTELKRALNKAGFNKRNKDHTLIVCGDIFDRGPDTLSVYKFLTSIPKNRCILIKGNHELLYEELLDKSFPESHDFSNHTVDTFCQIAGYDPEILTPKYWRKFDDVPHERIRQAWQEILTEVKQSPITAWLQSDRWKYWHEVGNYIFVHSFIPLKNLDHMPAYYTYNRKFEYFKDWRETAKNFEFEDATWGCPYQQYIDGYFKEEAANGKVLVCGHWTVTDFRQHINNKWSEDTSIYKFENIIGLDCGVWKYRDTKAYYHPQNVLVIDDKDFNKCYDQYGIELKDETTIPRIETVTEQN